MMSCGEIGAETSVASTLPVIFDLARVDIDQMAATAATATMPPTMMILRIPHHLCVVRNCAMHWHIIGGASVRCLTHAADFRERRRRGRGLGGKGVYRRHPRRNQRTTT